MCDLWFITFSPNDFVASTKKADSNTSKSSIDKSQTTSPYCANYFFFASM